MQNSGKLLLKSIGLRNVTTVSGRPSSSALKSIKRCNSTRQFASMKNTPEPVHILGLGNLGKLFAYSLAKCNQGTPITLLFHRSSLIPEWDKAGRSIEITTKGVSDRQTGFEYELLEDSSNREAGMIKNLVVATKTYTTVSALRPILHRLNKDSTLLFLQNGMGTSHKPLLQ
jgi:ketopantoate reductase